MFKKSKKYTPDVLAVGIAAFAGSAVTQRILIQPKTDIKITENFSIPIQGVLPFSQKYVAEISQKALNEMLPLSMSAAVSICEKLHVREEFKKGVLWFVYDFMGKYSLNTFVNFVFGRFTTLDTNKYKDVIRDYIQNIITEKADRDEIIQKATMEVIHLMRLVTEGTVASMLFSDRFAEAASGTVAAAIDRFLANDAASKLTDYIFGIASQLEDITIPSFLTNVLGLGRTELANLIDVTYDSILGPETINMVRELRVGDVVYQLISSIDYNHVYDYVSNNDLVKLNVTGAMTAMSFYATAKKLARRHYRRKDKTQKAVKGIKGLFTNDNFLEDEE